MNGLAAVTAAEGRRTPYEPADNHLGHAPDDPHTASAAAEADRTRPHADTKGRRR